MSWEKLTKTQWNWLRGCPRLKVWSATGERYDWYNDGSGIWVVNPRTKEYKIINNGMSIDEFYELVRNQNGIYIGG